MCVAHDGYLRGKFKMLHTLRALAECDLQLVIDQRGQRVIQKHDVTIAEEHVITSLQYGSLQRSKQRTTTPSF